MAERLVRRRIGRLAAALWPIEPASGSYLAVLVSVPVVCLLFGAPLIWPGSTLLVAMALIHTAKALRRRWLQVLLMVAGTAFVAVANVLLAVSYYLQGGGFNDDFFFHLRLDVIDTLSVYAEPVAGGLLYLLVAIFTAVAAGRPRDSQSGEAEASDTRACAALGGMWLFVATLLFTPAYQWIELKLSRTHAEEAGAALANALARPVDDPNAPEPPPPGEAVSPSPVLASAQRDKAKNLVFIYLEGLEQAYFDEDKFPGLMPRLSKVRARSVRFTKVYGLIGATVTGIFASQCGWPAHSYPDPKDGREAFLPGLRCVGDVLADAGHRAVYMGGADHSFAGKGAFFRTHGFDEVLGRSELAPGLEDPAYTNRWGLYDDSLFSMADRKFQELVARDSPFTLTLLTLGTHHPGYPAASCPSYAREDDPILQAVHCTDAIVADFVERVRRSPVSADTVVVILSDHLMSSVVTNKDPRFEPRAKRHLTFMIDVPWLPGEDIELRGTQFDVGPTLLAIMGLGSGEKMGLGSSLLDGEGYLWTEASGVHGGFAAMVEFIRSSEVRDFVDKHW